MGEGNESRLSKLGETEEADEKVTWLQALVDTEGVLESPIDINLAKTVPLQLPTLNWHNHELPPKKMKLTNTGHTLILSAKWNQERPFLSHGPLLGNYVFSQLHFHWGCTDMEGSEHTIDGCRHPLEMHMVHFKSCYLTQESALKEKDGIVVLAFIFKLQAAYNPAVQMLVDAIPFIQRPHCSTRLENLPLSFLVPPFGADYFLYWGSVATSSCLHLILWLISREPIGISTSQVESFRSLLDTNEEPLTRNFRAIQPLGNRRLFHVCPSPQQYSTLLPTRDNFSMPLNIVSNTETESVYTQASRHIDQQVFAAHTVRCGNPFGKTKYHILQNGRYYNAIKKRPNMHDSCYVENEYQHGDSRSSSPENLRKSTTAKSKYYDY